MLARITVQDGIATAVHLAEGDGTSTTTPEQHIAELEKELELQKPANPVLPETSELIFASIAFIVLFILMRQFAYPGIRKAMDARTQKIRDNLDSAEKAKGEAESILADYQRQLADAKNESNRIIEEARQQADQLKRDLMRQAEAEVAEIRQRTTDDIAQAQARAMAELQSKVAALAVGLAERIVERSIDANAQRDLIDSYINQLNAN